MLMNADCSTHDDGHLERQTDKHCQRIIIKDVLLVSLVKGS